MTVDKSSIAVSDSSMKIVDPEQKDYHPGKEKGLGWFITGLFVIGDIAGGGIIALPAALIQMDVYPGIILTALMALAAMYTAVVIGDGWVIMQRRWPQYRVHCRKPYAEMGYRSMGSTMKHVVSASIVLTQFGTAVVFLLLSSKNIGDFLQAFFGVHVSYCILIIIVGISLLPLLFLKSPQDFWWAVVAAMITTTGALILLVIGAGIDFPLCHPVRGENEKSVPTNYFLGLGTLLFSFGGHAAFPTIVNDMKKPSHFARSSIFAFGAAGCMYIPVSVIAYVVYGNSVRDSVINSIQNTGLQQAVNILITLHCLLALTIIFNPLNQEAEELFNVPHKFGWQRAALRTAIMIGVIFVAESLPTFGPLLNLVGGSTLTLTSIIFPALFYIFLKLGEEKSLQQKGGVQDPDKPPSLYEVLTESPKLRLAICGLVVALGTVGGACATYSAVRELTSTRFTVPCYVQPFLSNNETNSEHTNLNCCGSGQNITRFGNIGHCSLPSDFYNQNL